MVRARELTPELLLELLKDVQDGRITQSFAQSILTQRDYERLCEAIQAIEELRRRKDDVVHAETNVQAAQFELEIAKEQLKQALAGKNEAGRLADKYERVSDAM